MSADCQPGDILLVPDEGYFSLVSVGQGIARLNPVIVASTASGSIYSNHAAIACGTAKKYNSEATLVSQVAHATSTKGICRGSIGAYGDGVTVFRLHTAPPLADAAHNVALKWTEGVTTGAYAVGKALTPAF